MLRSTALLQGNRSYGVEQREASRQLHLIGFGGDWRNKAGAPLHWRPCNKYALGAAPFIILLARGAGCSIRTLRADALFQI